MNDKTNNMGNINTKPIELAAEVRKNGFDYVLLTRTRNVAIYEQKIVDDNGISYPSRYEVFIIKVQREREFDGRLFPRKEKFPSNEDFGKLAWSITNYDRAYARYLELVETFEIKK